MDDARERNGRFLPDQHDHGDCVAAALEDAKAVCVERGVRLTPVRQRVRRQCSAPNLEVWQGHRPLGAYAHSGGAVGAKGTPRRRPRSIARWSSCPHPGPGGKCGLVPVVVAERVRRLLPSRPSRRGTVPAVHRLRLGGRAQRSRHRAGDRARRGGGGLRLQRAYRRDRRGLPQLPRGVSAPEPPAHTPR